MNDQQLAQVYEEGKARSHTEGLRAVYEAGRKHDERERAAPPAAAPVKAAAKKRAPDKKRSRR